MCVCVRKGTRLHPLAYMWMEGMQLAFILSGALKEGLLCVSDQSWLNRDKTCYLCPPEALVWGAGQIRMPLCGDTMPQGALGPGGQEGHREAPISCFVLDQLGDQTQQMIPGPFPCVWHCQGIHDGSSLTESRIGRRGNLAKPAR